MLRKSQLANLSLSRSSQRSSQRILKVVNIIGSKRSNTKESSLSATRVSQIRASHYRSNGEKVTLHHTGSKEQLRASQELALASGFKSVKMSSICGDTEDYPSIASMNNFNNDKIGANSLSTKARKSKMILSTKKRSGMETSKNQQHFQTKGTISSITGNLNQLLNDMDSNEPNPTYSTHIQQQNLLRTETLNEPTKQTRTSDIFIKPNGTGVLNNYAHQTTL